MTAINDNEDDDDDTDISGVEADDLEGDVDVDGTEVDANGSRVNGSTNAGDMPRTGDSDIWRNMIVGILFIFGCFELVSSISVKEKVKVKK